MKRIYISDVVHEQLKREAKAEGRTLQWVVEARLTGTPIGNTPLPKNTGTSNLPDKMQNSITCPKCGMTSYNANDIREKYCGNCMEYHDQLTHEKKSEATPLPSSSVSDLFATPVKSDGELECCKNEMQPCKHWVWDVSTGEGYKNTLSGRFLEVE